MPTIEPFVRWAGGKTWLIPYLHKLIDNIHIEHYHEPFLGGAAIFFSLNLYLTFFLCCFNHMSIRYNCSYFKV